MNAYLNNLATSTIPFPNWSMPIIWIILFIISHMQYRRVRFLLTNQNYFTIVDPAEVAQTISIKCIVAQFLLAALIFSTYFFGGSGYIFIAGGWVIMAMVSVAINTQSILFYRSLSCPMAAEGTLKLANQMAFRNKASYLFGAALLCLLLGILLAHLAILGAALFITATAIGYLRKSNIHKSF